MRPRKLHLVYAYYRLSDEEYKSGESSSIANQRMLVEQYCQRNNLTIVKEFVDDGFSGANFLRPDFQRMLQLLDTVDIGLVITKDLSRLGRDMREASYFAEQYFPERGIRYLALYDNFDTDLDNIMAPFQFAMNEVYLRDGSRKVRAVIKGKREDGQYCACPPYGYKKGDRNKSRLTPDEQTAPVVQLIFKKAAEGMSTRKISEYLNEKGIIPPLKYRVLYRDDFGEAGAARASDKWNYTTVKRILKNQVYLGHTLLGKSKKASIKSKKKVKIPEENWTVTRDTHEALVTQELYDRAQRNLAHNTKSFYEHPQVRKSIFGKIAFCAQCGHAMCSGGSVYKGEREKYWYLTCNNIRVKGEQHCEGARIRYFDLVEVVRQDLNQLLCLTEQEMQEMAQKAVEQELELERRRNGTTELKKAKERILSIDKVIGKLYRDNAEGKIDDARLDRMVTEYERESAALQQRITYLEQAKLSEKDIKKRYHQFYELAKQYSQIEVLDRDTLLTFIERIEIGGKVLPDGLKMASCKTPYQQEIQIYYRFIGKVSDDALRDVPRVSNF